MTARVSLSRRCAESLLEYVEGDGRIVISRAAEELRRALNSGFKSGKKAAETKRKLKRETKRDETARIRAAVFARVDGRCDICGANEPTDLHHVFGRVRVRQSERNCLALCRVCHHEVTVNRGGAAHWWLVQGDRLRGYGFVPEAALAFRNGRRSDEKSEASHGR